MRVTHCDIQISGRVAPTSYLRGIVCVIPDYVSAVALRGEAEVLIGRSVLAKLIYALRRVAVIIVILSLKPRTL
jgi:hypothetical protein